MSLWPAAAAAAVALLAENVAAFVVPVLPHLPALLLDNSVHGVTAGACWAAMLITLWAIDSSKLSMLLIDDSLLAWVPRTIPGASWLLAPIGPAATEALLQVIATYLLGCGLDLDHFVAARSTSIADASRLNSRPWGHAVLFVVVSAALAAAVLPRRPLWALLAMAWSTHQARDALRRGFLLWPLGLSTPPISMSMYLGIVAAAPLLATAFLLRQGHSLEGSATGLLLG